MEIRNSLGAQVAFYALDVNTDVLDLNLERLLPGIFYAAVTVDGSITRMEKLVVIK